MRHGSLYAFNPRNTGLFEARLWQAYYDPRAVLLCRLLRSQFGLNQLQALRAACWDILAALAWKPRNHDGARVEQLLTRFYAGLRRATRATFDPEAVGAAELHNWAVRRALDGQEGSLELVEAHAQIVRAVYGLSREQALRAARARAHARDLVDAITDGRQAPTAEAWTAVAAALRQAYSLLREAACSERTATL